MMHVAYEVPEAEDFSQHRAPLVVPYSEFFAMRAKARFNNDTGDHAEVVERFCAWLEEKGWS